MTITIRQTPCKYIQADSELMRNLALFLQEEANSTQSGSVLFDDMEV